MPKKTRTRTRRTEAVETPADPKPDESADASPSEGLPPPPEVLAQPAESSTAPDSVPPADPAAVEKDLDTQIADLTAKRAALLSGNGKAAPPEKVEPVEHSDLAIDASLFGQASPPAKTKPRQEEFIYLIVPSDPPIMINGHRFIGKCKVTRRERDMIARMVSNERSHQIELLTGKTSVPWLHAAIQDLGQSGVY